MLKPYNQNKSYANRPLTPLGDAFGLTSTPVSEVSSRQNSPPPLDPYKYQPAITLTHPSVFPNSSSNYTQTLLASDTTIAITQTSSLVKEKLLLPHQRSDSTSGADSLKGATEQGQAKKKM
jgi:hypothetical protein